MTFFSLLKTLNFDWEKATSVFYNLTDTQIYWINKASEKEQEELERKKINTLESKNDIKKSWNLRGR